VRGPAVRAVRVVRAGAVRAGLVATPVRPGGVVSAGWALPAGHAAWPAVPRAPHRSFRSARSRPPPGPGPRRRG